MNADTIGAVSGAKGVMLATVLAAMLSAAVLIGMLTAPVANAQAGSQDTGPTPEQIVQRRYEQARPRTAIPFDPKDFAKFSGYYEFPSQQILHIFREGDRYLSQLPLQPQVEIYPDSQTEFFIMVVPAQISFLLTPAGQVSGLVLHQNGLLQTATKVSEQTAQNVEASLQARIKADRPSPGTEAAARRTIEAQQAGHPNYREMAPGLAALAQLQQPLIEPMLQQLGALKSLTFKRVSPTGMDIYDATFAGGALQVVIAPLASNGRIISFGMRRPPP